ncbi:unnamed protein product [Ectocarpus sp. 13 AM-2016]
MRGILKSRVDTLLLLLCAISPFHVQPMHTRTSLTPFLCSKGLPHPSDSPLARPPYRHVTDHTSVLCVMENSRITFFAQPQAATNPVAGFSGSPRTGLRCKMHRRTRIMCRSSLYLCVGTPSAPFL